MAERFTAAEQKMFDALMGAYALQASNGDVPSPLLEASYAVEAAHAVWVHFQETPKPDMSRLECCCGEQLTSEHIAAATVPAADGTEHVRCCCMRRTGPSAGTHLVFDTVDNWARHLERVSPSQYSD